MTLHEDFIEPYAFSADGIAQNRFSGIMRGRRGITADTALRLERAFGVSASFQLNLQSHYELEVVMRNAGHTARKTVKLLAGAA